MLLSLAAIGIYVLLVGVASFLERPVGQGFDSLQLNLLVRAGSVLIALTVVVGTHGLTIPLGGSLALGLGIGLLACVGSLLYCLSLRYLPVSVVVSLANLYLVVTVLLGVIVLHEPLTLLTLVGVALTVVGAVVLSHAPIRDGVHAARPRIQQRPALWPFGLLMLYITLIGVSTFLEKPVLHALDATQLNAAQAMGMVAVAIGAAGSPSSQPARGGESGSGSHDRGGPDLLLPGPGPAPGISGGCDRQWLYRRGCPLGRTAGA